MKMKIPAILEASSGSDRWQPIPLGSSQIYNSGG